MYLGSFAQGLFNGAQSAANLYSAYQGIRLNDMDYANAQEWQKTSADQALMDQYPGQAPAISRDKYGTTVIGSSGRGSADEQPKTPDTKTTTGPVNTTRVASTGGPVAPGPPDPKTQGKGAGIPAGYLPGPGGYAADTNRVYPPGYALHDPYDTTRPAPPVDTGRDVVPPPPAAIPPASQPPVPGAGGAVITQPGGAPDPITRLQQTTGINPNPVAPPGGPWGSSSAPPGGAWANNQPAVPLMRPGGQDYVPAPAPSAGPTAPVIPPSANVPVAPTLAPVPGAGRPAIPAPSILPPGSTAAPSPAERPPPAQPAPPSQWELQTALRHGFLPPNTPIDQQTNSYYDGRQWTPIPPGTRVGGQPQAAPPAAGGARGVSGTILAALGHLNPIGSAQAAEAPPPSAPAAPAAPGATPPATPAAPPAALPTGQTGIGAALNPPGQGAKPASPPTPDKATGAQSEQAPAPVPVKQGVGGQGAVAPNQQGPSQQSQTQQPATGLPVTPSPWQRLQHDFPQSARRVQQLVDQWGAGVVFPDQVAAHWQREGGLNWNTPRGHDGEYGPMQVMPDTFSLVAQMAKSQGLNLDPNNPEHGMIAGILYLRYLAVDRGFGANSVSTNYAYMAGPAGARNANFDFGAEARSHPDKVKSLIAMYPGIKLEGTNFTPGSGSVNEQGYMTTLLAQNTPDGVLTTMATMGPQGLGMTDRWRHLQGMMEGAAIARGHYDMLPHIADFIAQTAHQGAVSNLASGYAAIQNGDMQGAAGALAKAHAFFPDGSYARFGVDKSNRLFAEQFDERTGQALGKPFMVTPNMVAQQMIALQNPRTFLQTLQQYQKANAEIGLANAHASYYKQLPDIRAEQLQTRQQMQDDRLAATARENELKRQHQDELVGAKNEANRADSDKVRVEINKDYGQENPDYPQPPKANASPAEQQAYRDARNGFSQRAEVDTHLRLSPNIGGAGMSGPAGRDMADRVVRGEVILRSIQTKDGFRGYGLFDKDDAKGVHPHGFVDENHGAAILRGLGRAAQPIAPQRQAAISPVGAGAGSQMALSQGYNQNLAGIPTQAA